MIPDAEVGFHSLKQHFQERNKEMCTHRNGLRMLTGILCIAVTVFIFTSFANANDEVQYKSYDLKGYTGSIEVDQSVRDKIQDKAIKEIAGETKSKTRDPSFGCTMWGRRKNRPRSSRNIRESSQRLESPFYLYCCGCCMKGKNGELHDEKANDEHH